MTATPPTTGPDATRRSRRPRTTATLASMVLAASALTGCATAAQEPAATPASQSPATSSPATSSSPAAQVPFDAAETFLCQGLTLDGEVLAEATPVADLTGDAAAMLDAAMYDDGKPLELEDPDAWYLAQLREDGIAIMREAPAELAAQEDLGSTYREFLEVRRVEGASNIPDGWYVMAGGGCSLTIDLGDLTVPTVELDPATPPSADTTELHLLVTEAGCNSGRPADGRIELVSHTETAAAVTVTLGIEPESGDQTCQGNPPTPFVVTLEEPLGDRDVIDGARGEPITAP
ncbi:hypothetical protein ACNI3K_01065 [Demequina sp. SO4-13]|uniref:hypothetical protein n=1 Tax=Demequina sp. SO4-13 TaxID=3401027 RepID=UPI003AF9C92E